MEIKDYIDLLRRRIWVIALSILVTVAVAAAGSLLMVPVYAATATVRIATATDKTMDYSDVTYADRLMNTYGKIVTSEPVLTQIKEKFGLAKPPKVKAEPVKDTELISITAEDPNPILARDIANALADVLVARSRGLYTGDTESAAQILGKQLTQVQDEMNQARSQYETLLQKEPTNTDQANALYQAITVKQQIYSNLLTQYEEARVSEALRSNAISIIEPATIPKAPSVPDLRLNLLVGGAVGGILGIGLVFLFNSLDTTLYSASQIRSIAGTPILGQIPTARRKPQGLFLVSNSPQAEAFRRLRINLSTLNRNIPVSTLLVTSAEPGEGKTTIAANLAHAMAQSKQKALLVDCELRLPSLHKLFGVPNEIGLSTVLNHQATLPQAIQETQIAGLWILTSGAEPSNPSELINSSEMIDLIKHAAEQFEIVVLDTPALLAVKHSLTLASLVDGVLLVVQRAHARQSALSTACELLINSNAKSIGVVVNHAEMDSAEIPV